MKKKIAVVLSGCGHKDGSEITEAVSTLIALSELGVEYKCFAPSVDYQPAPHSPNTSNLAGNRNAIEESGRISRGDIQDIKNLSESSFDALVFPGGFGAAKNLCDWATKGSACSVNPEVARTIRAFHQAAKPIGAICIAPALIAKVLGSEGVQVTLGDDKETAKEIEKTGARHVRCAVNDYISDRDHKVLSTPAYMYAASPFEVFTGIRKMIRELVEMA